MKTYEDLLNEIDLLKKENEQYKSQLIKVSSGLSKHPDMDFISENGDWKVIIKNSYNHKYATPPAHHVPREHVYVLYNLIKAGTTQDKPTICYRELVPELIKKYCLDLSVDEFNGGHHRGTYYAYYYLPVRILQHLSLINYNSKGKITIKKENSEL